MESIHSLTVGIAVRFFFNTGTAACAVLRPERIFRLATARRLGSTPEGPLCSCRNAHGGVASLRGRFGYGRAAGACLYYASLWCVNRRHAS